MTDFQVFFIEGFEHITDFDGIDHIAFVCALTSIYLLSDWRKLLILITAFTIGHSITLALSSFNLLSFDRDIIEFLIPLTILLTAVYNLASTRSLMKENTSIRKQSAAYTLAAIFGLIHGLGFSSYLKSLFGKDENIVVQLLSFNLGLEAGQLIIVAVLLFISFIFVNTLKLKQITYVRVINSLVIILSVRMCIERFPF
jgi:uncharacterized membrane protein YfcA